MPKNILTRERGDRPSRPVRFKCVQLQLGHEMACWLRLVGDYSASLEALIRFPFESNFFTNSKCGKTLCLVESRDIKGPRYSNLMRSSITVIKRILSAKSGNVIWDHEQ